MGIGHPRWHERHHDGIQQHPLRARLNAHLLHIHTGTWSIHIPASASASASPSPPAAAASASESLPLVSTSPGSTAASSRSTVDSDDASSSDARGLVTGSSATGTRSGTPESSRDSRRAISSSVSTVRGVFLIWSNCGMGMPGRSWSLSTASVLLASSVQQRKQRPQHIDGCGVMSYNEHNDMNDRTDGDHETL